MLYELRNMTADDLKKSRDTQLQKALDVVRIL